LWCGPRPALAWAVCGAYVAVRTLHSALLLWPRQPLRTQVFGVSLVLLFVVLADGLRMSLVR
jgi:hypothetical protein